MIKNTFRILATSFLTIACSLGAIEYEILDMGLRESDQSDAYAIDENGTVYGTFNLQGQTYSFNWNEKDGLRSSLKSEETEPTHDGAVITKLERGKSNYSGTTIYNQFTGIRRNTKNGFNYTEIKRKAFIKTISGELIDLGSFGGAETFAYGINDNNQVVGVSQTKEGKRRAFLWQNGKMIDLGVMCGDLGLEADDSSAIGINNKGQIVGSSKYTLVYKGKIVKQLSKVFLWENGSMRVFMPDDLSSDCIPYGITDSGIIFLNKGTYDIETNGSSFNFDPKIIKGNLVLGNDGLLYDFTTKQPEMILNTRDKFTKSPTYNKHWMNFRGSIDFNSQKHVIAIVDNVYGERHVVLIRPVKN